MTLILSGSDGVTFPDSTEQETGYANGIGFRNRIINGDMRIDQRNAGASVTITSPTFITDRWLVGATQASKFSIQQNAGSVTPPVGFTNYLGATSLSAYAVASGDAFYINQKIEGFNAADLAWGTANAKTVTLSFWVRSSLTGTFGGSIYNSAADRSYPYSYTISSADTWEQKSITIAGDTSGTWLTNNGTGITVLFSLGYGTSLSGTANTWAGAFYGAPTGATSVVGTNGATFYITGVQLEVGSVATPFERRPYGTELSLCQRYYENVGAGHFVGRATGATTAEGVLSFVVPKRASPTISLINGTNTFVEVGVAVRSITTISASTLGTSGVYATQSGSSSLTSPNMVVFYNSDTIVSASAEL